MNKKLNMDEDQYRDLLTMLNDAIYKYAEKQGIDLNNTEQLIQYCNSMEKIKLGKETTELLLDGIMNYDVGDQRVLKFIDLEGISFANQCVRMVDFRGTNANIDPQTVKNKNIEGANFEGIDMSDKYFDGCIISSANLSYTNATINPQKVRNKDLERTKCDGLDLSNADFTDVYVLGASFKNAKINLDPQKVRNKDLTSINLENVDMSDKNFNNCILLGCNLTNSNAVLDLNHLDVSKLYGLKLKGTTLLVGEEFDEDAFEKQKNVLGIVKIDDYTLTKRKIQSLIKTLNI